MGASLHIQNLVKEYRANTPVLKDISLDISGEGLTAIIGPSGTGKSTLLRCVNRLIDPTRGSIVLDNDGVRVDLAKVRGAALRKARRNIGMVFQEYNLVERLTVMENLLTGRLGYTSAFNAWLGQPAKARAGTGRPAARQTSCRPDRACSGNRRTGFARPYDNPYFRSQLPGACEHAAGYGDVDAAYSNRPCLCGLAATKSSKALY